MTPNFMPIDTASYVLDISRKELQNLSYVDAHSGRSDRFTHVDGVLFVHKNYKCPHYDELTQLYYKALECAQNEKQIAKFIADRTGKNINAVYFYFRNSKFKDPNFARIVAKLLKIFIKQNNLFADLD